MNSINCFAVIFLLAVATVSSGFELERIVGGTNARDGEFPYQVSLRQQNSHFCGGSILNKRWILTAAHCLHGQNARVMTVVTGTNSLSKGGDSYPVEKTIIHENYDSKKIVNDIGLIRVTRDIAFNGKVKAVRLPSKDIQGNNYPAVLSGWGRTSYPSNGIPDALQRIDLRIISQNDCSSRILSNLGMKITNNNICTLTKAGQGACQGDSGGPLTADGVQVGVVSYGIPCAKGFPDVYTRVWTYLSWVKKNAGL